MSDPRTPDHGYRKSSFSTSQGACVEVRKTSHGMQVRDSKDPFGPTLVFEANDWARFARLLAAHKGP